MIVPDLVARAVAFEEAEGEAAARLAEPDEHRSGQDDAEPRIAQILPLQFGRQDAASTRVKFRGRGPSGVDPAEFQWPTRVIPSG